MTSIEEIWIAKDGICLFHKYWSKKPIDLNIQLFSAFTSAINTFAKSFFPTQPLRSIDFIGTRFLFDYVDRNKKVLVVIKFTTESNETALERQGQILKTFIIEFNAFLREYGGQQSLSKSRPFGEYYVPINSFVENFHASYRDDELDIRKFHFLNVIWYLKSLNTIFVKILSHPKFTKKKFNNIMIKNYFDPANHSMSRLTPIIFDIILKMDLTSSFDLKKFRDTFEIEKFPDIPYKDIRNFLKDFITYFANIFKSIGDEIPTKHRREIFSTYVENYNVLKYFRLDEEVTFGLLPVFS